MATSQIAVGDDGRRFINELIGWRHGKIPNRGWLEHWPGTPMHHVFDQKALDGGPLCVPMEVYAGGWHKIVLDYQWTEDNLAEVERGWIVKADTLAELAQQLGLDADALEQAVADYNAASAAGEDPLGRPADSLEPIEGPPYYGYTWGQNLIYTCGGPRKNEHGRVLDPFGEPIPGLYVAGQDQAGATRAGRRVPDRGGAGLTAGHHR